MSYLFDPDLQAPPVCKTGVTRPFKTKIQAGIAGLCEEFVAGGEKSLFDRMKGCSGLLQLMPPDSTWAFVLVSNSVDSTVVRSAVSEGNSKRKWRNRFSPGQAISFGQTFSQKFRCRLVSSFFWPGHIASEVD